MKDEKMRQYNHLIEKNFQKMLFTVDGQ